MRQEEIRCIDEAAADGRYILNNTDAVPQDAEMRVIQTLVQTAQAYGRY